MKVADIKEAFAMVPMVVDCRMSIEDVLRTVVSYAENSCVYVEDEQGKFIGCIRPQKILEYCFPFETMLWRDEANGFLEILHNETITSLIDDTIHPVTDETPVATVITIMGTENVDELPVVNDTGKVTGRISLPSLVQFYLKNLEQSSRAKYCTDELTKSI